MRFIVAALLMQPVMLTGCGTSTCTPTSAYGIPAHWIPGHYQEEQRCTFSDGKYHWVRVYVPPSYAPTQYVPAVTCGKP